MKNLCFQLRYLLLFILLLAAAVSAAAQSTPPQPGPVTALPRVYTYVEQMPQMPTGGSNKFIIAAIQRLVAQSGAPAARTVKGSVFTIFTVGADGLVSEAKILKGLGGGADEAVLAAVQSLPRLIPGRQMGQRVAVSLTLPIAFPIASAQSPQTK